MIFFQQDSQEWIIFPENPARACEMESQISFSLFLMA